MNTAPLDLAALAQSIKDWGRELGFQQVGIADVQLGEHEAHLQRWLDAGYQGEMDYMAAHGSKRSRPDELVPGTLRVVSLRMDYLPGDTQMAQRLVCTRAHSLDQQFCRWLLQYFDHLPANTLQMTQELIASLLGVRRGGVSEMAGSLQRAGVISYRRGSITLLNRPVLEGRSCECYAVVKDEFERLFPRALRVPFHSGDYCAIGNG